MFHCNGGEPSSYYFNIILQVKLEIYDKIVFEVADLCTSCEVGLIDHFFNCIFVCFV